MTMVGLLASDLADMKGAHRRHLTARLTLQAGDERAQKRERVWVEAIAAVGTVDGTPNDARLLEHLQVLGDRRLRRR
jgi:hypothetical protein